MSSFYPYGFSTYQATHIILSALHILTQRVLSMDTWREWHHCLHLVRGRARKWMPAVWLPGLSPLPDWLSCHPQSYYKVGLVNLCWGNANCQISSASREDSWGPELVFKCQLLIHTTFPIKLCEDYKCLGLQRALFIRSLASWRTLLQVSVW
jgi:hypothetical protein